MSILVKFFSREKGTLFLEFKDKALMLSEREIAQIYREVKSVVAERETDLNEGCVKAILDNLAGRSVLAVGCGKGFLAAKMSAISQVTALDITVDSRLAARHTRVRFVAGNIEAPPFGDRQFDTVVCAHTHTLEHVQRFALAVSELRRVTKGRPVIVVPKQRPYRYTFEKGMSHSVDGARHWAQCWRLSQVGQQEHRVLQEPLDLSQIACGLRAVRDPVIGGEGGLHHVCGAHRALLHDRSRLRAAHRQDGSLRRVDDRDETLDVEHPQVAHRERPTLQRVGTEFPLAGAVPEILRLTRDLRDAFLIAVPDDRDDQPLRQRHGDAHVDLGVPAHRPAGKRGVEFGKGPQGQRRRPEH